MLGVEIGSVAGVILVGLGLLLTWVRNGRDQGERDGRIESQMENLNGKMDTMVKSDEGIV